MQARYTGPAITLHWLLALLLPGQFVFGLMLEDIPRGTPARGTFANLHKSSGIVIGVLVLLRIGWRLTHRPPPLPATMPAWQRHAARLSHIVLYLCMVALPLSGYLASNFSRHGIKFFNLVHWLPWGPDDKALYALFNQTHHLAAMLLAIFVVLHLPAVAKHMLIDRDGLLSHMWPQRTPRGARLPTDLSAIEDVDKCGRRPLSAPNRPVDRVRNLTGVTFPPTTGNVPAVVPDVAARLATGSAVTAQRASVANRV